MKIVDRKVRIADKPQVFKEPSKDFVFTCIAEESLISTYLLECGQSSTTSPVTIKWKVPAVGVKGVWTPGSLLDKRIRADWELPPLSSRISVDAPVVCVFGHKDENILTVSASDVINTIHFEASIQEEDNHLYFTLTFFDDDVLELDAYSCKIRLDYRSCGFSDAIQSAGKWLETRLPYDLMPIPESARLPLYSTWYSYHQNFSEEELLSECRRSKELGYEVIIVDDGWQTTDGARGYDFTGDWEPVRIPDIHAFVSQIHAIGMKLMFWYSVPFCGKKSKAYKKFKGKFLTESHPWAPVFDIRFPEVRQHLIERYVVALRDWDLDGFKLDFIDDFRIYPETEMEQLAGRDTLSVNHGVELLICEIKLALTAIKPEVLIEFRQKYISPMLKHLGNMFRAFDCPYDSLMNRVRTTDVKMLCGASAVHSDMLTWNMEEAVELAALQFTSILFSVPQLSVKLNDLPKDHLEMVSFYTRYWLSNRKILLDGKFTALKPLANYPILSASNEVKCIYGIYEDTCIHLDTSYDEVDLINGQMVERLIIEINEFASYEAETFNCKGDLLAQKNLKLTKGIHSLPVPASGMVVLQKS